MEKEEKVVLEEEINENSEVESNVETKEETKEVKRKPRSSKDERGPRRGQRNTRRERDSRYEERVVSIKRVSKTIKGGRKISFSAIVVIGDGKGTVGFGTGKANEVPDAIKKALDNARKNLIKVPMVKGDTFKYEVIGRYGSVRVFLKPAPLGTGIVAGGPVRVVLELAGVKNIYSKIYGSRTPINVVRATINAIESISAMNKTTALRNALNKEENQA